MNVLGIGNVSRCDTSTVRRSTAAATAGSLSRATIALAARSGPVWGTIWRLAFVFVFVYSAILLLGHLIFFTGEAPDIQVAGYTFPAKNFMTCFYVIIGTLILSTGYLINRLATRKARRQQ